MLVTVGICMVAVIICTQPASASVFVYGSAHNYSEVILPNNSYVHQGENISRGNYYDLSGVYGWSGVLGNWKNQYNVGYTNPDNVKNLNSIHYQHVLIDDTWGLGEWYQIDSVKNSDTGVYTQDHSNSYVFAVVDSPNKTEVLKQVEGCTTWMNTSMYVFDGNKSVEVPITVKVEMTSHVEVVPVEQPSNAQTIVIPTTEVTTRAAPIVAPIVVTPRTPLPIWCAIFALVVIVCLRR